MNKYSYELKMQVIRAYQNQEGGCRKLAKRFNVHMNTVTLWCRNYEIFGESIFTESKQQKSWSAEIKLSAVQEYLSGNFSLQDICKKYKISSQTIVRKWIKVYNDSHKELKSTATRRNKLMTKGRKVTFDEKVEIVQYCIANGRDYYATMKKYQISYQQIYSWLRKYDKGGIDALVDRRGKAKPENKLTDTDRLRIENKMLEAKNMELEMEIRLLKKLQEIERRRY